MSQRKKSAKEKFEDVLDIANEELVENNREPGKIITGAEVVKELKKTDLIVSEEDEDFALARKTIVSIIGKAVRATEEIAGVCAETGHPRSFEVQGQLLKVTSDLAKDLMALRKTKAELNKFNLPTYVDGRQPPSLLSESDTVFTGTTAEMIKALNEQPSDK